MLVYLLCGMDVVLRVVTFPDGVIIRLPSRKDCELHSRIRLDYYLIDYDLYSTRDTSYAYFYACIPCHAPRALDWRC